MMTEREVRTLLAKYESAKMERPDLINDLRYATDIIRTILQDDSQPKIAVGDSAP